jgi:hypothetical protein
MYSCQEDIHENSRFFDVCRVVNAQGHSPANPLAPLLGALARWPGRRQTSGAVATVIVAQGAGAWPYVKTEKRYVNHRIYRVRKHHYSAATDVALK